MVIHVYAFSSENITNVINFVLVDNLDIRVAVSGPADGGAGQ